MNHKQGSGVENILVSQRPRVLFLLVLVGDEKLTDWTKTC